MSEHYHQIVPEQPVQAIRGFFGRVLGLNIDWAIRAYEHPLDTPIEPVTDWPPNQMVFPDMEDV